MSTHQPHDPHAPLPHTPEVHESLDAWHDHSHDERPQHPHLESINAPKVIGIGVGLFLAVAATVALVYGFYVWYNVRALDQREGIGNGFEGPSRAERDDLSARLNQGYAWANHDAALLPLDQGVDRVVKQYATKRAASSGQP
jgi:hypothetical protein